MKKIGIHFKNEGSGFNISLFQLFKIFNFQDYIWEVDEDEVYMLDESDEMMSDSPFREIRSPITGHELQNIIENKKYYPIFLTLRAYSKEESMNEETIRYSQDFLNSECEFLLSIVDTNYFTILCKDEGLMNMLNTHVQSLGYIEVKYLTTETFGWI